MRPLRLLCSAMALAAVLALPAAAAVVSVSAESSTGIFFHNGHAAATITHSAIRPNGVRVHAGGFAVQGDLDGVGGAEAFTAWCLDIATSLRLTSNYTATPTPFSSGVLSGTQKDNIERLFETGFKTLNLADNNQSAGFQLALWEVLYDSTASSFNLATGSFRASNSTALAAAQALLTGMTGPRTQQYNLTFLQSTDARNTSDGHYSQHLVTVTAVPLPAGGILLLAGLGALAALRRRAKGRA